MSDAPVIAPKSSFEDRWNGIVRPYSQVSRKEREGEGEEANRMQQTKEERNDGERISPGQQATASKLADRPLASLSLISHFLSFQT